MQTDLLVLFLRGKQIVCMNRVPVCVVGSRDAFASLLAVTFTFGDLLDASQAVASHKVSPAVSHNALVG